MAFEDYTSVDEVVEYLKKPFSRTGGVKKSESYVYHYTCFENLKSMLKSKEYWLSSPYLLNDQHEYTQFPKAAWKGMYLASFVAQEEESMAMWSMYGKKWEQAVKVSFRMDLLEAEMMKNKKYYIDSDKNLGKVVLDDTDYFASIGYAKKNKNSKALHCGTVRNTKVLKDLQVLPNQFVGFIKDAVWSYEKEVRFVVKIDTKDSNNTYGKIAVDLSSKSAKELWETIEITPSPRFSGDLSKRLKKAGFENVITKKNKFENQITGVDSCKGCKNRGSCYA